MIDPIARLEALLGDSIPQQYREFLERADYPLDCEYAVSAEGHYWTVDAFFMPRCAGRSLGEGYQSVRNSIPSGSFPILSTLGGFLILYGNSCDDLNVYYWDHEQPVGQTLLLKVASSVDELEQIIMKYDSAVGG